jgi:hypothetical protein
MKSIISYRQPKFQPLPTAITNKDIADATLPVKIEAARRAIQQCEDLPELLRYQDQAQGLAAAVRIMKHVAPELVKSANEMVADAWRRGGELLKAYSSVAGVMLPRRNANGTIRGGGRVLSPRGKVVKEVGLSRAESIAMVRIAEAPIESVYAAAQLTKNLHVAADRVPARRLGHRSTAYSDGLRNIMYKLTQAFSHANTVDLGDFDNLTQEDRKIVKDKIIAIEELLDKMHRLCR